MSMISLLHFPNWLTLLLIEDYSISHLVRVCCLPESIWLRFCWSICINSFNNIFCSQLCSNRILLHNFSVCYSVIEMDFLYIWLLSVAIRDRCFKIILFNPFLPSLWSVLFLVAKLPYYYECPSVCQLRLKGNAIFSAPN